MAPLQVYILGGFVILGVQQASSSTIQDSSNTLRRGHNTSARESHSLNRGGLETDLGLKSESGLESGLESGPAGQAWVHTHWYQQQPSKSKVRTERFARPYRSSSNRRGKRSSTTEIFRERRHARFGGRAGLGLHWARDQFGHKMVLDRCFDLPPPQGFQISN